MLADNCLSFPEKSLQRLLQAHLRYAAREESKQPQNSLIVFIA
jgi:hypothetical protein